MVAEPLLRATHNHIFQAAGQVAHRRQVVSQIWRRRPTQPLVDRLMEIRRLQRRFLRDCFDVRQILKFGKRVVVYHPDCDNTTLKRYLDLKREKYQLVERINRIKEEARLKNGGPNPPYLFKCSPLVITHRKVKAFDDIRDPSFTSTKRDEDEDVVKYDEKKSQKNLTISRSVARKNKSCDPV